MAVLGVMVIAILESLRVIFLFGGRGKILDRASQGSFGRVLWLLEGLGKALVMLASDCDYLVRFPYSIFHFCFLPVP